MQPPPHSETARRLLRIIGKVQAVGYRQAMQDAAQRLGVSGWVRNRLDGSVEALLQGPAEAVAQLIEWARHGPPVACVQRVEVSLDSGEQVPPVPFACWPTL